MVESREEKTKGGLTFGALLPTSLVPHGRFVFSRALLSSDNDPPRCSHLGPTWSRVAANKLCQRVLTYVSVRIRRKDGNTATFTDGKERQKGKNRERPF